MRSNHCACIHCFKEFSPGDIVEWVDEDASGTGQTAICPYCSVDTVVGSNEQTDIDHHWLKEMYNQLFS